MRTNIFWHLKVEIKLLLHKCPSKWKIYRKRNHLIMRKKRREELARIKKVATLLVLVASLI